LGGSRAAPTKDSVGSKAAPPYNGEKNTKHKIRNKFKLPKKKQNSKKERSHGLAPTGLRYLEALIKGYPYCITLRGGVYLKTACS
jgi:hypothetical protein